MRQSILQVTRWFAFAAAFVITIQLACWISSRGVIPALIFGCRIAIANPGFLVACMLAAVIGLAAMLDRSTTDDPCDWKRNLPDGVFVVDGKGVAQRYRRTTRYSGGSYR